MAATFGIAHPTGYPTLMLLAGLLVRAIPLRPVLVLDAFAALLVALGAGALTLLLERVVTSVDPARPAKSRAVLAGLAGLATALTPTWWQQANGFEVYPLHTILMPLVVATALRWLDAAGESPGPAIPPPERRAGFGFALVTGLAFTNHLTTVLLAPGLLILAIARFGAGRRFARHVLPLALPFALGLLPYAWLPLRSSMHPRFDWGATRTLPALIRHVTGAAYHGWMFSDAAASAGQWRYLKWRIPADLSWLGVAIALVGAVALARRAPRLLVLALSCLVTGATFAIGYRIAELDPYLLTTALGGAMLLAAGLAWLASRAGFRAAAGIAVVLIALHLTMHWRECDESGNVLVEDFVHDLLGPLPEHAVLFTSAWSEGQAASLYFQEVEGFRRDVLVINPDLTRTGWYLDELRRRAPELVDRAAPEFARYRALMDTVERGRPYDVREVRAARATFLDALAARASRDRGVFATTYEPELRPGWERVPYGLALWLRADTAYVAEPAATRAFRPWTSRIDADVAILCWARGEARWGRAEYEAEHGHADAARRIAFGTLVYDPGIDPRRVTPLPLATDSTVIRAAGFFAHLRAQLPASR